MKKTSSIILIISFFNLIIFNFTPCISKSFSSEEEINNLIAIYENPKSSWGDKRYVIKRFGIIKNKKTLPILYNALIRNRHKDIRISAANAIGEIKDKSSLPELEKALRKNHGLSDILSAILRAIGTIGDPGSLKVLRKYLRHKIPQPRESACESLYMIATANKKYKKEIIKDISNFLDEESKDITRSDASCKITACLALERLATIHDKEALKILNKIRKNDSNKKIKERAERALRNIKQKSTKTNL